MDIGIIGGGATGLTAAHELIRKGAKITVYEKSEHELGGLAGAVPIGKTQIEKVYHHIFNSDTDILKMIDELGLTHYLRWEEPKNGMVVSGKLYPFTSPKDLIMFPAVSFISRIRMGLAVLNAKNVKDYKSMESVSAKEWLVQKTGRDAYDKIWKPLLYSKFETDADNVSGVWIWNKFKLRGSTRSNINSELLGYLSGSFVRIYDALVRDIRAHGGQMAFKPVKRIAAAPNGKVTLTTDDGECLHDKVLFTGAPDQLRALCDFPDDYLKKLDRIRYKCNVCMTLVTKKKLSDYYWVSIAEPDSPFVVFIEHTNLINDDDYEGRHIFYLSRYIDAANPFFQKPDSEVAESFLQYLGKLFPHFERADVIDSYIYRTAYAQPVIGLHYSENVLPFETPAPNLYLASMSQVYPEDRGQNYAIRMGRQAADIIARE